MELLKTIRRQMGKGKPHEINATFKLKIKRKNKRWHDGKRVMRLIAH